MKSIEDDKQHKDGWLLSNILITYNLLNKIPSSENTYLSKCFKYILYIVGTIINELWNTKPITNFKITIFKSLKLLQILEKNINKILF